MYVFYSVLVCMSVFFFFKDAATTEIYPSGHSLSLHDALPISLRSRGGGAVGGSAIAATAPRRGFGLPPLEIGDRFERTVEFGIVLRADRRNRVPELPVLDDRGHVRQQDVGRRRGRGRDIAAVGPDGPHHPWRLDGSETYRPLRPRDRTRLAPGHRVSGR